jgi:UDP-N-acetylglucosamine acyltransferase
MSTTLIHPTAIVSDRAQIGDDVEIGPYAIIGDDCEIGPGCVIAPRATLERNVRLAANVKVGSGSILGGDPQDLKYRGEETWVEIGEGGMSRVAKDVPPFLKAVGNPVKLYGLNSVGLQRSGFPDDVVRELKRAYRLLFRSSDMNLKQAIERARAELVQSPEMEHFLAFIEASERGIGF